MALTWKPGVVRMRFTKGHDPEPFWEEQAGRVRGPWGLVRAKPLWVVVHTPSGVTLKNVEDRSQADELVRQLEALPIDWLAFDGTLTAEQTPLVVAAMNTTPWAYGIRVHLTPRGNWKALAEAGHEGAGRRAGEGG